MSLLLLFLLAVWVRYPSWLTVQGISVLPNCLLLKQRSHCCARKSAAFHHPHSISCFLIPTISFPSVLSIFPQPDQLHRLILILLSYTQFLFAILCDLLYLFRLPSISSL